MLISQILRMMFTFKWCRKAKRTKSGCRIKFSRYSSKTEIGSSGDRWGAFSEAYTRRHLNCLCTRRYPFTPPRKMIKHHQRMKFVSSRIFFRLTAVEKFTFHAIKKNNGGKEKTQRLLGEGGRRTGNGCKSMTQRKAFTNEKSFPNDSL